MWTSASPPERCVRGRISGSIAWTSSIARRHGARQLRQIVEADAPAITRSKAEDQLLALVRVAELPAPQANARLGPYEVRVLWRDHGLVVEVDGFAFHSSRRAFERDRERDAHLTAEGLRVVRVTWRRIVDRPKATIGLIARALGR